MSKLPEISKGPIVHVDCTPDKGYPLRILQAYRQNCDCYWTSDLDNPLIIAMNKACEQRAEILDEAIAVLENNMNRRMK